MERTIDVTTCKVKNKTKKLQEHWWTTLKFIYKSKKFQGHDSERCINMILIHCRHALHRYATGRRHPNSRGPGSCRDPSAGPAVAQLCAPRVQPEWGGQCFACIESIYVFALLMLAMQITLISFITLQNTHIIFSHFVLFHGYVLVGIQHISFTCL